MRARSRRHPRPRLICRARQPSIQKKQKLIRAAVYRGWLPKSQPHPHCPIQRNPMRRHVLIHQQINKATPRRMRPNVSAEQMFQGIGRFERCFALANPLHHRIAPCPMRQQPQILVRQMNRKVDLPLRHDVRIRSSAIISSASTISAARSTNSARVASSGTFLTSNGGSS